MPLNVDHILSKHGHEFDIHDPLPLNLNLQVFKNVEIKGECIGHVYVNLDTLKIIGGIQKKGSSLTATLGYRMSLGQYSTLIKENKLI